MITRRLQQSIDQNGARLQEEWDAPPLSKSRVNSIGRHQNFSMLGATERFSKLSSGTATSTSGTYTLTIPIQLVSMTTSAADLVTNYVVGHAFKVLAMSFVTTKLGTGTAASQVINLEIGTTNLTGGVLTLVLADTNTLGKKTDATAITALNTGTLTDTLSVEVAASGTVYTAGDGNLLILIQNLDTVASNNALGVHVGTGTEVISRSTKGGQNFKTQASSPADNDNVYFAPVTDSGLIAPITAASQITFSTQIQIGSAAFAKMFASFGFNENPTNVNPTSTAGDGMLFLYDPTREVTTGLTVAQHLNWILAHKVLGVDTFTATAIPVQSGVDYALDILLQENLTAKYYIDGVYVGVSPAMTSATSVSAFVGAELTATPPGQADFDVRFIQVGRYVG